MRFVVAFFILLLMSGQALAGKSWSPKDGETLRFVLKNEKGKQVGTLQFSFVREGAVLTVTRIEKMHIKKFLMRADVDQTVTTIWNRAAPVKVHAKTVADTSLMNKTVVVNAVRDQAGAWVATANDDDLAIDRRAWPMSLWHRVFIKRPVLFGLGGGETVGIDAVSAGFEPQVADGRTLQCEKFVVTANVDGREMTTRIWFERNGRLCAMISDSGLGAITYQRTTSGVIVE